MIFTLDTDIELQTLPMCAQACGAVLIAEVTVFSFCYGEGYLIGHLKNKHPREHQDPDKH